MDEFTYYNIFETKGIEYLAIITFFLLLVPFWFMLNRRAKVNRQAKGSLSGLSPYAINVPQGIFFSKNHTWTYLEKSGLAKIGLDGMLLHLTGDITVHQIKKPGERISKGEVIAEIQNSGKYLKVLSPVSGEFISSNKQVVEAPEIMTEDTYEGGWLCKVKPFDWVADTNSYYLAENATEWSKSELQRFKDFLTSRIGKYSAEPQPVILQDGGELRHHVLSKLPVDVWNDFQQNFMAI